MPTDDVEAIQRVCADYIEAWLDGDVDRMRRCLHPQLAKRRVKDSRGTLHEVPNEDMIADVLESPKRGVGRDFEIAVFDVARDSRRRKCCRSRSWTISTSHGSQTAG